MEASMSIAVDARALLGEGPDWDPISKQLHWVDIIGRKLHAYDPCTHEDSSWRFDQDVAAVVRRGSGGLVLLLGSGIYSYDQESAELSLLLEPEKNVADNRFNDAKCDPRGRLWGGTMSIRGEAHRGKLYCLDTTGKLHVKLSSVTISNGLAWHPTRPIMYYIDSPTQQVVAFDYTAESGEITNPRGVIDIPKHDGMPDGMTIDSEGKLWISLFGGWQVGRWDPETGRKLDYIPMPVSRVTSCAFGGDKMNELFITTACVGYSSREFDEQPHAGALFRCELNVSGPSSFSYQG